MSEQIEEPNGFARTTEAVQQIFGPDRLVTKAIVIAEVIDVTTGEPWLVLRTTEVLSAWEKEGMLAYALRIEQAGVSYESEQE
ncbi:hypothetical protein [Dactylosporangium sp. CA-139066]|uniref:hypothetical protein n=1 Tax=Dactylosporangium sp. CA-139066 TaxID=3239930 RepID=UPI003D8F2A6F